MEFSTLWTLKQVMIRSSTRRDLDSIPGEDCEQRHLVQKTLWLIPLVEDHSAPSIDRRWASHLLMKNVVQRQLNELREIPLQSGTAQEIHQIWKTVSRVQWRQSAKDKVATIHSQSETAPVFQRNQPLWKRSTIYDSTRKTKTKTQRTRTRTQTQNLANPLFRLETSEPTVLQRQTVQKESNMSLSSPWTTLLSSQILPRQLLQPTFQK